MSELFLFAGNVVEPDVTVDRTKVDYGALMLGAALKETFHIVNREAMPHSFVFDKSSLGMAQVLHSFSCLFSLHTLFLINEPEIVTVTVARDARWVHKPSGRRLNTEATFKVGGGDKSAVQANGKTRTQSCVLM